MPQILIIKTSSMGDVIHNLPIVNDILGNVAGAQIDWLVEEAYADLVALHTGVRRVIPVAQRRWRRSGAAHAAQERAVFEQSLRECAYDVVLDTQGLMKSAMLGRIARVSEGGRRVGFSRRLVRESLARLLYDEGFDVDPKLHASERLRSLAAQVFGYEVTGAPDFGLKVPPATFAWLPAKPFVVLLHATSRAEKAWPLQDWRALASVLCERGLSCVVPFGTPGEKDVAQRIVANIDGAIMAPALSLREAAQLLAQAHSVVGVDTGLTHLAAALEVRTVALFGATPRWRYAPYWTARAVSLGEAGRQPAAATVLDTLDALAGVP